MPSELAVPHSVQPTEMGNPLSEWTIKLVSWLSTNQKRACMDIASIAGEYQSDSASRGGTAEPKRIPKICLFFHDNSPFTLAK